MHEYPASEFENKTEELIEGDYYITSGRSGDRNNDLNKYKKDIEVLLKGIEDEPNNGRYIFYLAQSYLDDKQYEQSNIYYLKRFNMGGWVEESYYSLYKIGENNIKLNKSKDIIIESLLKAFHFRPSRLEALYTLVDYLYNHNKDISKAAEYVKLGIDVKMTTDILFVTKSIHRYLFLELAYDVLFENNEFDKAHYCINTLLENQLYPYNKLTSLELKRERCIPKIINKYITYPETKINNIMNGMSLSQI